MKKHFFLKLFALVVLATFALSACGGLPGSAPAATPVPHDRPAEPTVSAPAAPFDPKTVLSKTVVISGTPADPELGTTQTVERKLIVENVIGVDWTNDTRSIVSAEVYVPGFKPQDTFQIIVRPNERIAVATGHSLLAWVYHSYTAEAVVQDIMTNSRRPFYNLDVNGNLVLVADLSTRAPAPSDGNTGGGNNGGGAPTNAEECKGNIGNANENGLTSVPANCWAVVDGWGPASTAAEGETINVIVAPGTALSKDGKILKGSVWLYPTKEAAEADMTARSFDLVYFP